MIKTLQPSFRAIPYLLVAVTVLMMTGCFPNFSKEDNTFLPPGTPYWTNLEKGAIYRLRQDMFIMHDEYIGYYLYKGPGATPDSIAEYKKDLEKDPGHAWHWQGVVAAMPKGTRLRYENARVFHNDVAGNQVCLFVTCLDPKMPHFGLIDVGMMAKDDILERVSGPLTQPATQPK